MDMCKWDKGEGPQKPRPLVWLRKQGNLTGFKTVGLATVVSGARGFMGLKQVEAVRLHERSYCKGE